MNLAVLYADIFNWTLTKHELVTWHITGSEGFKNLRSIRGFFVLPGREKLVIKRRMKESYAQKKWIIAKRAGLFLQIVPTITLVGVTGGLARNNVQKNDDIDLFCLTQKGTLWTSRFLATLLMEFLGLRRRPKEKSVADKICLNMFMSERRLAIRKNDRDLFCAHEVLQMIPIWEREGAYRRFLLANGWVSTFLPNAWKKRNHALRSMNHKKVQKTHYSLFIIQFFEPLARVLQLWYMRKRRTTEVIKEGVLRFHPVDARVWVRREFVKRLRRYNLPLDKFFYSG